MNHIVLKALVAKVAAAGAVAVGGFEAWKYLNPRLQSLRTVSATGHVIQVVVPVKSPLPVPVSGQATAPVPPNNGTAAIQVLPKPVMGTGLALEPMIITPSGHAANLTVDSTSDIQRTLNTLGWVPALVIDGQIGPKSTAAIKSFQQSHGLIPDGNWNTPVFKTALQNALARVAGTQSKVGQSLAVQSAPQTVQAAAMHGDPATPPVTVAAANSTPVAQALAKSGLDTVAIHFTKGTGEPNKDAITQLQKALNVLGASPPLKENGDYSDETVAAIKAFQITYGLAADGVPGAKTATAIAVAVDPNAKSVVAPSVDKAAEHVDAVAATAPPVTAAPLVKAAADLKVAAISTPAPTDVQTHTSTVAAQAATATSAAPVTVAVPLAAATNALAAATTTPAPNPELLNSAAKSLADAATNAIGTSSAPSLAAAANHVANAAVSPDVATQGDHLNAAAQHLANAATGAPSPATAGGEFGFWGHRLRNWWQSPDHFHGWHRKVHPTYAPAVPGRPYMHGDEFDWAAFDIGAMVEVKPVSVHRSAYEQDRGNLNYRPYDQWKYGGPGGQWQGRDPMRDWREMRRMEMIQMAAAQQASQQPMQDPNAINQYDDPNAGRTDPVLDSISDGGVQDQG
jgi:peptidoglycan hydrolase-like protein with peptidoglycan-binding domain